MSITATQPFINFIAMAPPSGSEQGSWRTHGFPPHDFDLCSILFSAHPPTKTKAKEA